MPHAGWKRVRSVDRSADNSGTTTYTYQGNTVTVADPAGKWKKYTTDVFGNLTRVTEPNPAGGADHETYYAYDLLDRLTGVTMPQDGVTQTLMVCFGCGYFGTTDN